MLKSTNTSNQEKANLLNAQFRLNLISGGIPKIIDK